MQATPLALDFYQFNRKDFIVVGGVEGTLYVIKVKILEQWKKYIGRKMFFILLWFYIFSS